MIQDTLEKVELIRKMMKVAQDRLKFYADKRRTEPEFEVDDLVFVKISPLKRVMRFGNAQKLEPRYIGTIKVLERI